MRWVKWRRFVVLFEYNCAAEGGLNVLPLFYIFFFIFLTIFVRPIISTSTEPIFAKFAGLVELWQLMNELRLVFFICEGTLPWQSIYVGFVGFYPQNWVRVPFGRWRRTTRSASAAQDAGEPINNIDVKTFLRFFILVTLTFFNVFFYFPNVFFYF